MPNDYTKATRTRGGYAVKDINWNPAAKRYLGLVADPNWKGVGRDYVTASWHKSGKSVNAHRPDCDLILP